MRAAALLLAGGWAATLWLAPFDDERVSDLFVYRSFAEPLLAGSLPYRELFLEYPPLAAPAIALPGLFGTGEEAFRWAFAGWTLLLAAAVVVLCGVLAQRTGGDRRRALLAAALTPLLLGALVRTRFDLAPVVLLLGALALLLAARPRMGMAVLGLAVMTKGFAIVAAPPALAWIAARTGRRSALGSAAAFAAALALPALVALALSPAGAIDAVQYHFERPVQVESLPATAIAALDLMGAAAPEAVQSHRSDGLEHAAADWLAALGAAALLLVVGALTAMAHRHSASDRALVLACLSAVLAYVVLGKVLSPQYLIWLAPLGALALAWRMHALALALLAAAVLTQLEFPARYFDLVAREPLPLVLVALRNLALVAALVLALRELQLGRQQQLLDRARPARVVALDEDGVDPRVLV